MRALIVDDSRFTRKVLRELLEQQRFECSDAPDAAAGLEHLRADMDSGTHFDVALIDWNMPGMSGLDMVKEMRARGFDRLKIMMVTSHCDSEGIQRALEAGADEYLMKPFDAESLTEKLALMGMEIA